MGIGVWRGESVVSMREGTLPNCAHSSTDSCIAALYKMDEWQDSVDGCGAGEAWGGAEHVWRVRVVQGLGVDRGAGHAVLIRMLLAAVAGTRGMNPRVESVMH